MKERMNKRRILSLNLVWCILLIYFDPHGSGRRSQSSHIYEIFCNRVLSLASDVTATAAAVDAIKMFMPQLEQKRLCVVSHEEKNTLYFLMVCMCNTLKNYYNFRKNVCSMLFSIYVYVEECKRTTGT